MTATQPAIAEDLLGVSDVNYDRTLSEPAFWQTTVEKGRDVINYSKTESTSST